MLLGAERDRVQDATDTALGKRTTGSIVGGVRLKDDFLPTVKVARYRRGGECPLEGVNDHSAIVGPFEGQQLSVHSKGTSFPVSLVGV